jgi:nucleolin
MSSKRPRDAAPAPAPEPHELQVYAAGLPYTASEADVRAFFAPCGEITLIRAPTYQDTGRLRGFAHVTFAARAGVAAALALDGAHMGARYVSVAAAKPAAGAGGGAPRGTAPPGRAPKGVATLFARNLPYDADEDSVRGAFAKFGAVASVRLPRRSDTGATKGFGYVQFEHAFAAEAAVAAAAGGRLLVGERAAAVDWDTGAPKASFKAPDGRAFAKTDEAAVVKTKRPRADGAGAGAGAGARGPRL